MQQSQCQPARPSHCRGALAAGMSREERDPGFLVGTGNLGGGAVWAAWDLECCRCAAE